METHFRDECRKFIAAWQSGCWSMSELCARFGISRPTGYKWRTRAAAGDSLEDRSHAPHYCPHRIAPEVAALLVAARRQYGWGARKLLTILTAQHPSLPWPARSTVNDLFAREHRLRRRRRRAPPTLAPSFARCFARSACRKRFAPITESRLPPRRPAASRR